MHSVSFSHLLGNSLDEVFHVYDMLELPDVSFQIFERLQHLVADEAVSRQLQLVLTLGLSVMFPLPILDLHTFKLSLLSRSIGVDNHQLRKGQYFQSFLSLELYRKVVSIFTAIRLILAVDVVAHQQRAEMAVHVVELQLLHIIAFVGEQIPEDFVGDWSHADHLGDLQAARILPAGKIGIPILSLPLDSSNLSQFFLFPQIVLLNSLVQMHICDGDVREEMGRQFCQFNFIHEASVSLFFFIVDTLGLLLGHIVRFHRLEGIFYLWPFVEQFLHEQLLPPPFLHYFWSGQFDEVGNQLPKVIKTVLVFWPQGKIVAQHGPHNVCFLHFVVANIILNRNLMFPL